MTDPLEHLRAQLNGETGKLTWKELERPDSRGRLCDFCCQAKETARVGDDMLDNNEHGDLLFTVGRICLLCTRSCRTLKIFQPSISVD